jgi:equilibrative nucleoside transporter 1/2/3
MSGMGVAGLVGIALRVITKVSLPNTSSGKHFLDLEPDATTQQGVKFSAIIYFAISAFILFICMVSYWLLTLLPIAKYFMGKYQVLLAKHVSFLVISYSILQEEHDRNEKSPLLGNSEVNQLGTSKRPTVVGVFKKLWKHAVTVFFVFFITLSLFPGLTGSIPTSNPDSQMAVEWFQIIMVVCFHTLRFVILGRLCS